MGQVYLARDQNLVTRRVAVKTVRPDILNDENLMEGEAIARFEREARAAASIHHPNVVDVTDFGKSPESVFFLVMEFVDGETLYQLLRREGTLDIQRSVGILSQVVAGVDAALRTGAHAAFVIVIVLALLGIAWVVYYYVVVRVDPTGSRPPSPAARPSWPTSATGTTRSASACSCSASRSRPPLAPRWAAAAASWSACSSCFLIGLLWICTYYVVSDDPSGDPGHERPRPVQPGLGIAFMAVGFTFATRWE